MILSLGSDLVGIQAIEKPIERFSDCFLDRILTESKNRRGDRRRLTRTVSYARRLAAEAAARTLDNGFRRGVSRRDLGVVNPPSGPPGRLLTGGALRRLQAI